MTAVPLYHAAPETLAYSTLAEALRDGFIAVTEVNAGGSVPDLKVVNKADSVQPVACAGQKSLKVKKSPSGILSYRFHLYEAEDPSESPKSAVLSGDFTYLLDLLL